MCMTGGTGPMGKSKAITMNLGLHNHSDLIYFYSGSQNCAPGHAYGPSVRNNYLIHYVRSGKGIFRSGSKEYALQQGQGFLISSDEVAYYKADPYDPWHYSWVCFDGLKAESILRQANLSTQTPIFAMKDHGVMLQSFNMLEEAKKLSYGREMRLVSGLYLFLSHILEYAEGERAEKTADPKALYIKSSIEYIEKNFSRKMAIQELADYIGLNRSYLCAIFKEALQISPQEYLVRFRMEHACALLGNRSLSVGDVARSVGYDDPFNFSKMFTKVKGAAPREYRKRF
jgi:AraC-like DNA-binding protein